MALGDMTGVQLCMDPAGTDGMTVAATTHQLAPSTDDEQSPERERTGQSHTANRELEPRGCDPMLGFFKHINLRWN